MVLILSPCLITLFFFIGIKRIKPISFPRRMDPGLPFRERIANLNKEYQPAHENPNDMPNLNAEGTDYDEVDHLIDLHGHIIGMGLSPDHRFDSIRLHFLVEIHVPHSSSILLNCSFSFFFFLKVPICKCSSMASGICC